MRRTRACRDAFKIALRQREGLGRIDITKNEEHGIIGRVVGMEKRLYVVEIGGIEIVEVAVEIVSVRPIAKRDRRKIEPGKTAVRLIEDIDADFFFDYVALILQVLVVHF